jgi:hypothetical protein
MPNDEKQQHEKLIQLIRDVIQQDVKLREKHQVGDKFRFIRDRLQSLLSSLEESARAIEMKKESAQKKEDIDHETHVYVYLYNAQGLVLRSWTTLLTPKVFYEYSVNRPIYSDRSHVETLVKSKANKMQHGYLTVAVKRDDVVSSLDAAVKDAFEHPIIRVKEGSLRFNNLVAFTHNGEDYMLNEHHELVRKSSLA